MTTRLRAGHLPGLDPAAVRWHELRFQAHGRALVVEVPQLTAAQMGELALHVERAAQRVLQAATVAEVISMVDRAVACLLDPADPVRSQLDGLLPIITGDDPELVRLGLTASLQAFRAPQLRRFVAQDFANPAVLDGFQPAVKGGSVRAFGPRLLAHVWAGNVPGLPWWSLVAGLLVKAGSVGKLPSAEPLAATLFVRLLAQVHPPLADCLAVVWWKGGDSSAPGAEDAALYRAAEVVLAYGGGAALEAIRAKVPVTTRFLGYGHKLGAALVGRAALDRQRGPVLARLAALDVVRFEQQGCYSPHVAYVERGGAFAPREFAQHLAAELANLAQRHPRRALSLEQSREAAAWRQSAEWGGPAAQGADLLADGQGDWAVAYSEFVQPFAPTAGLRHVQVCAVDRLDDVLPRLAPHAGVLQTIGLAADPSELHRLAALLGALGATRIASIGGMTRPEAGWHHDGRGSLADLVRWVEIEQAAEREADRFASYAQEGAA